MGKKKLAPQDAETGRARNTRAGGRHPSTQRPTDKSMPLYTMTGKKITIAERDGKSEEERIAEIKSRLFTLFDEEDAKEREYAEQNRLKNRATGAFWKIKNIIGDGDDVYDERAASEEQPRPEGAAAKPSKAGSGERSGVEQRARARAGRKDPRGEEPGKRRDEQERRTKPVNPVNAKSAEKSEVRGKPRAANGEYDEGALPVRARTVPARRGAPADSEPKGAATKKKVEAEREDARPDASFRLGDLFKEKEPDIFGMWEREDEEEKRIRERRERRRAEAAKRVRGEDGDSKMKTAAALFIAREGVKNLFGKFSGTLAYDAEREEEEREAEKALRELADAKGDVPTPSSARREPAERPATEGGERTERKSRKAKKTQAPDDETTRRRPAAADHVPEVQPGKEAPAKMTKKLSEDMPRRKSAADEGAPMRPARGKPSGAVAESKTAPTRMERRAAADGIAAAKEGGSGGEAPVKNGRGREEAGSFRNAFRYPAQISRTAIAWIAGGAAGAAAVVIIAMMIVNNHAVGVSVGGAELGYVEDKNSFTELVADVKEEIARDRGGVDIVINDSEIALADTVQSDGGAKALDAEELKDVLLGADAVKANCYTINVNGKPLANLPTKEDAQSVLDNIVGKYADSASLTKCEWQDDIEISSATADLDSLVATQEAIDYLLTGNEVEKKVEVKDGDTLWGISKNTGYEMDEIIKANPEIDPDRVHTGDVLKLNDVEPFVRVETTEVVTKNKSIGYGTVKKKTDEMYEGQTKVETKGKKGKKKVTLEQVKVNGEVTEREEISTEVIKEPEDEVVLVGTKERDGWYYTEGGGSLGRPMRSLSVSSGFGWRTHPISGARRQHTGTDFRAPMGTPVYSAESGTVSSAGWGGGYGNLVIVNHGGGVVTYYAHLSSIGVSPGERVGRGQQVGRVGSTGSSTGPHLHFEVRIGGTPQNPMNYL